MFTMSYHQIWYPKGENWQLLAQNGSEDKCHESDVDQYQNTDGQNTKGSPNIPNSALTTIAFKKCIYICFGREHNLLGHRSLVKKNLKTRVFFGRPKLGLEDSLSPFAIYVQNPLDMRIDNINNMVLMILIIRPYICNFFSTNVLLGSIFLHIKARELWQNKFGDKTAWITD